MSITTQKDNLTLSEDELYAYNETLKAFQLISNNMNKSNEALNSLNLISSSIEKGKNKIAMLEKFNISTNKIFKLKTK
jgi:ABC-type Fe3+-citrate transport system substrate-binding protein